MAAPSDRIYFPPLEECLKGEKPLITWKLIASSLADPDSSRLLSASISAFLDDEYVGTLLRDPSRGFPAPSAQSKQEFETKTAAINVTPTPNEKFDLQMIKGDSTWLSKTARIAEPVALRIAVVELQARPESHLAGPLSAQDVTNIQDIVGYRGPEGAGILPALAAVNPPDAETVWADFESEESRRKRLLLTYLSERRHFAITADYMATRILASATTSGGAQNRQLAGTLPPELLLQTVPSYLDYLRGCVDRAATGPDFDTQEEGYAMDEALAFEWGRTALMEAFHFLSLVFQMLDRSNNVFTAPQIVTQWFKFAADFGFLSGLLPQGHGMSEIVVPLQCLLCAISMLLLNMERSIELLDQELEQGEDEQPYIQDPDVLLQIHTAITAASEADLPQTAPIAFAWAVIVYRMHMAYQERAEKRDLAQNQRAQAGFELEGPSSSAMSGRRNSTGSIISIEARNYDVFLANAGMGQDIQVAERLALGATGDDGLVYNVLTLFATSAGRGPDAGIRPEVGKQARRVFLDLLKFSFHFVGYKSEPLTCLLALLSGGSSPDFDPAAAQECSLGSLLLTDPLLHELYFVQALNRYPYEWSPFISLCSLLATSIGSGTEELSDATSDAISQLLLKTPAFTFILPGSFQEYQLVQEDENVNAFQLLRDIPLFAPSSLKRRLYEEEPLSIPAGSLGRFITDSGRVVLIEWEHSALALMGKRLEAYLSQDLHGTLLEAFKPEEVAETISLLGAVVDGEIRRSAPSGEKGVVSTESAAAVLQEAGRAVSKAKDIVAIVCDILDSSMEDGTGVQDGGSVTILTACVRFLRTVLPVCPGRVWSYMSRCQLLGSQFRAGKLSRLTGNPELTVDRFDLLHATVRLLAGLVENAVETSVQRRAGASRSTGAATSAGATSTALARLHKEGSDSLWVGMSDKILGQVNLSVAHTAADIFENSSTWRYPLEALHSVLMRDLVPIMDHLVVYTYSLGDSGERLTGCMAPAAEFLVGCFLSSSAASLRFQPILSTLLFVVTTAGSSEPGCYSQRMRAVSDRTSAVLEYATSLVRAAVFLNKSSTALEGQLFKATPLLARLGATRDELRTAALALIEALVASAEGAAAGEPPSLLGCLGLHISTSFIKVLSKLDAPFDRPREGTRVWKLLTAIIRSRQRWIADCLLTGRLPRDTFKSGGRADLAQGKGKGVGSRLSSDSVLLAAQHRLRSISSMPSSEVLAVLEFLTAAQNFWPWTTVATTTRGGDDNAYLQDLQRYVHELKAAAITAKTDAGEAAAQARIAAYAAQTFAMQLYHLRQLGQDTGFAQELLQDLDYFLRDGVSVSSYNTSLHTNFAKNFAGRYAGVSLDAFKHSLFTRNELGKQYYFALDLAQRMLAFDAGWTGPRDNGFRGEMETANLNLSLVDAQIALFHAWEFLLLEVGVCLLPKDNNKRVTVMMAQVAKQCLEANQGAPGPEQIFRNLASSRANLALVLVQRLADNISGAADVSQLLPALWTTLTTTSTSSGSLFAAGTGGTGTGQSSGQAGYHRTLLKTLYVVLRGCRHAGPSVGTAQMVLNVLDRVVAQGFRSLAALVHEPEAAVVPDDVALVTAILQACLAVPGVDECQTQVVNIMASHDVLHAAMSLFSWADKLVDRSTGDPVYGELSLLFLLELSTVPAVAEQLALDGLLGNLTSARLAKSMRRPDVSPFAAAAAAQRCYSIWVKAVLPLLINVLGALGATIAPEVVFVLNYFPALLESSVRRFEAPGMTRTAAGLRDHPRHITLLAASEVHSLALLTRVLTALREQNARDIPEVAWDAPTLLENVEFWLSRPNLLRESLVPLGARETEWRSAKAANAAATRAENRLEEKVICLLDVVKTILSDDAQ